MVTVYSVLEANGYYMEINANYKIIIYYSFYSI